MKPNTNNKPGAKKAVRQPKKRPSVGGRIIEGLHEAIAWSNGEDVAGVHVTQVVIPNVDVREVRTKIG